MSDSTVWTNLALRILAASIALGLVVTITYRFKKDPAWQRLIALAAIISLGLFAAIEATGLASLILAKIQAVSTPNQASQKPTPESVVSSGAPEQITANGSVQNVAAPRITLKKDNVFSVPHLWVGGASTLFVLFLLQAVLCKIVRLRGCLEIEQPLNSLVRSLGATLEIKSEVAIYRSRFYSTPVAFGIFSPAIGIPNDFEQQFSVDEQKAVIAHELTHLANHDPAWRMLVDFLCILTWWNPVSWLLRRKFLVTCELVADAGSAAICGNGTVLAQTLVNIARRLTTPQLAGWSRMSGEYRSNLSSRVARLLETNRNSSQIAKKSHGGLAAALTFILCSTFIIATIEHTVIGGRAGDASVLQVMLQSWAKPVGDKPGPVQTTPPSEATASNAGSVEAKIEKQIVPQIELHTEKASPLPESEIIVDPTVVSVAQATSAASDSGVLPAASKEPGGSNEGKDAQAPETKRVSGNESIPLVAKQIILSTKWVEVSGADLQEVGLEKLFPEASMNAEISNNTVAQANIVKITKGQRSTNQVEGSTIQTFAGLLSATDFDTVLKKFDKKEGVDVLSSPRLILLSGQTGQVSIINTHPIITGYKTNASPVRGKKPPEELDYFMMEFGLKMDLVAKITEDSKVDLWLSAVSSQFEGYENNAKSGKKESDLEAPKKNDKDPLPKFRSREYRTSGKLAPGEVLFLGGIFTPEIRKTKQEVPILSDVPFIGRLFRHSGQETRMKHLLLFVQPELVDSPAVPKQ